MCAGLWMIAVYLDSSFWQDQPLRLTTSRAILEPDESSGCDYDRCHCLNPGIRPGKYHCQLC
jgi:hypothetical protein